MKINHFCLKSKGQNNYLVLRCIPKILLIHPVLKYVIEFCEKCGDLNKMRKDIEAGKNDVLETLSTSKKELLYYIDYFNFLKEQNYFYKTKYYELDNQMYTASMVEENFSNCEHLSFEVSNTCQLSCHYCCYGEYYEGGGNRNTGHLSIKTAKNMVDYFHRIKELKGKRKTFRSLCFGFYGGEPTLNFPFITEMVDYINSKKWTNTMVKFRITTNGVDLDKVMDYLVEYKFLLLISLDGNADHNSSRVFMNGSASFPIVFGNICQLKNKYPDYFEKYVNFNAVVHKNNSLNEVEDYFKNTFNKTVFPAQLATAGVKSKLRDDFFEKMNPFGKEDGAEYSANLPDFTKNISIRNVLLSHTDYIIRCYSQLTDYFERGVVVRTGTCLAFSRKIFLTVDGKIMPCERIPHRYFLGEADEKEVKIDFQKVAEKYNQWLMKMSSLCNTCNRSHNCNQCIFNNNLDDEAICCEKWATLEHYKINLEHNVSFLEQNRRLYSKELSQ